MSDNPTASTKEVKAMAAPSMVGMSIMPTTWEQLYRYANMIAESDFAPKDYKNKPANVMLAMQMGQEIGIKPLQAIQGIAVINGRPCVWGDSALALIQSSGLLEEFCETFDAKTNTATCSVKRKGNPHKTVQVFSLDDAKSAGLVDRSPVWKSYPRRMCQMRARGFALRDGFADVLKGLILAEEAQDVPAVDVGPTLDDMMPTRVSAIQERAAIQAPPIAPIDMAVKAQEQLAEPKKELAPLATPKEMHEESAADDLTRKIIAKGDENTFARQEIVYKLMEQNGVSLEELKSWLLVNLNVSKLSEIQPDDFKHVVGWITGEARNELRA